jgi:hypothetical protein
MVLCIFNLKPQDRVRYNSRPATTPAAAVADFGFRGVTPIEATQLSPHRIHVAPRPTPWRTFFGLTRPNECGGGESASPGQPSVQLGTAFVFESARERGRHERRTTFTGARAPPGCATRWWFEASRFSVVDDVVDGVGPVHCPMRLDVPYSCIAPFAIPCLHAQALLD